MYQLALMGKDEISPILLMIRALTDLPLLFFRPFVADLTIKSQPTANQLLLINVANYSVIPLLSIISFFA